MSGSMSAGELRTRFAADPELGAGNVLRKLREHGADPAGPGITFDVPVDGHPAWVPLTLGELEERVAARAAWLHAHGIRSRDPVAVYVTSAADCLLSFLALTWLGAIPALMNGNMPAPTAAAYISRLRCAGVLTDPAHRALLDGCELDAPMVADAAETGGGDPAQAPSFYRHHDDDPVAITHSSGTTRVPAAVVHSHSSLFAVIRHVRLTEPRPFGQVRVLSALPAAHTAGIITLNEALCGRYELLFLSGQGGTPEQGDAFAHSGAAVLDAIESWRPTWVFGFAVTWAELARFDLAERDLSSVSLWFNTGDCAHEAHVRRLVAAGSHPERTRDGVVSGPGSRFVDGLGSTEMGYSAFRITHRPGSEHYGRCVGRPHIFADVRLLDLDSGTEVPDGQVGHMALRSPTLALGYWNDSASTYRTRTNGYYLTGDLLYRDEEGYYYHVDRAIDAVDLGDGDWLYTAMTEERILMLCPDVRDCTVVSGRQAVAGRQAGEVVTDVLLMLRAGADPAADRDEAVRRALGDRAAATLRRIEVVPDHDIVVGPTGKVRKFLMRQRHFETANPG
jgi:acyl-coenzyme A synthetase/AMP-(fatty) acid ligase